MRYHVLHETRYRYDSPVALSQQLLHLSPRPLPFQHCTAHRIVVDPVPAETFAREDYFGNPVTQITLATSHQALTVRAESEVTVMARAAPAATPAWETVRDGLRAAPTPERVEPLQFAFESQHVECFRDLSSFALPSFTPGRPLLEAALDLNRRIHSEFTFDARATSVSTPLREVLQKKRGVCQDFAHLMAGCLRTLGLSARYVSGYILTRPPPGRPRLVGADASHAWVAVWCGAASRVESGWVDLDPTNNCLVGEQHVTLGWGRDFSDVTPMRGVILGGGDQVLDVGVTVTPQD